MTRFPFDETFAQVGFSVQPRQAPASEDPFPPEPDAKRTQSGNLKYMTSHYIAI